MYRLMYNVGFSLLELVLIMLIILLGHGIYCGEHDATTSVQGDTC